MTVFQLILALGIPSVSVLVGILLNQYGIGRVDSRIDKLDARMNKFEDRLLQVSKDIDDRFRKAEQDAERRNDRILDAIGKIQLDMRGFYRSLGQHEVRLSNLEKA